MRLLIDEHYSPEIARRLRKHGHDVTAVVEQDELIGLSDDELLARMTMEHCAILTENAADFVPLATQMTVDGIEHFGVLLTSPRSLPRRKDTIGMFVRVLDRFLTANPAADACRNSLRWLP